MGAAEAEVEVGDFDDFWSIVKYNILVSVGKQNERGDNMLTMLFILALIWLMWKIVLLGLKLTWGIAKFLCAVILLPIILIGLVCVGLIYIAIPVLIVVGIVVLVKGLAEA